MPAAYAPRLRRLGMSSLERAKIIEERTSVLAQNLFDFLPHRRTSAPISNAQLINQIRATMAVVIVVILLGLVIIIVVTRMVLEGEDKCVCNLQ